MTQRLRPIDHAVLPNGFQRRAFHDSVISTRVDSGCSSWNVDKTRPFEVIEDEFQDLLTENANVKVIASEDNAFAHEAGVYVQETDEVWFTSNILHEESSRKVDISRINLSTSSIKRTEIPNVPMGNGACFYNGGILFCEQGTSDTPSQLVWVDAVNPSHSRILLNNFHGRQFNSLNDVIVLPHCSGDLVWFTDPTYGFEQGFRPSPQLPPAVYVFDPRSGQVRMVADGFAHPNGIAFSPDGETCYITDTSHIHGTGKLDPSLASTIYAYDVYRPARAPHVPSLRNKRLFAFADCGVPDGIKCDLRGNVYAGCGDGIHVWNSFGLLIGKIILGCADDNLGAGCANFCFAPGGRLVCFSEDRIYLVEGLNVDGHGVQGVVPSALPNGH